MHIPPDEFGPHGIRLDSVKDVAVQNIEIDGGFSGVSFISRGGAGAPTTGRIQDCTIRTALGNGVWDLFHNDESTPGAWRDNT